MTTPSPPTIQPGDVLVGKYRVERMLGRGGMGMVVAARHLQLGELFAIKIMLPEMLDHPEALGRFLREAQASARLHGEHVARVHDVGTLESGIPYMVLEYLEGSDLDHELLFHGALGVGVTAAYVLQVCEALLEAHGQGIVHRDLKPANLFLTRRANGSACIKVLDFGISKDVTGADKVTPKLTKTGSIMGSPHYMSPEQLIDSKNVDARSDIWAIGIILYELVTGTLPFNAETMPEIIAKVLSLQPPPPSQVRPGISPAFDALVARCIEKNRDRRFQSVQEFMNALRPFADESDTRPAGPIQVIPPKDGSSNMAQSAVGWGHETMPSLPPGSAKSTSSLSGRKWMIAASAGVVLALGLVAFVVTQPKSHEPPAQANAPSSSVVPIKTAEPVPTTTETAAVKPITPPVASASAGPTTSPAVLRLPPPIVSTTNKVKKKVKGFDE